MNRKVKKIYKISIIMLLMFVYTILLNKVLAADLAVDAKGNNIIISSQYTGNVHITTNGGTVSESDVWLENSSQTITISNVPEGGAVVTVKPTGQMSDDNGNLYDVSARTVNIAGVKKAETTVSTPTPAPVQTTPQVTKPTVTYNSKNDTIYVNVDNANLRDGADGAVVTSAKKNTALTRTGVSTDGKWNRVSYNGGTYYIATSVITTKKTAEEDKDKEDKEKDKEEKTDEKSTNKALKDIVIENYKLTPNFDPETTKYTVDVTKEVEKLEIKPILADDKSKFEITGNENFKVGNNIVKITVTAEDGTNRIYTITVAKSNKEADEDSTNGLKLSKLQIKNLTLDPEFKPETTNYSVIVSDPSSIKIADITAVAEDEDVEVTIAEAEADKNGNRVITIMLENKDGSKSGVYQITIKKGIVNPLAEIQNNKNKKIYFILGGIIGVLVIAIIVVIILLKKTSNKGDIQDVKDADELSDDYDYSLKNAIDTASSEEAPEYDEIIEDSNVKSQILTKPEDYNVFDDKDNQIGVSDETKKYDFDSDDDDFKSKGKKKGKHF